MSGSIFEDDQISGFDELVASDIVDDSANANDTPVEDAEDVHSESMATESMADNASSEDSDLEAAGQDESQDRKSADDGKEKTGVLASVKAFDWSTFTVFDAMLLMALICISLATMWLFFELRNFGDFPFAFPWRTPGF